MDAVALGGRTIAPGRFVTLEGPDGAGKSLQAVRLAETLRRSGSSVTLTREPGGTALGERVRALLLEGDETTRSPGSDALLFNAARAQLVTNVIRPALERGDVVVCDRYADSTIAYQGYGAGLSLDALREIERFATGGLRPDLVILLDLAVAEGLARRGRGAPDQVTRFERSSDIGSLERVRRGYLELAALDPTRWRVIDAGRDADDVARDIEIAVRDVLALSEPRTSFARIDP